jgi:predicted nucleotidyltransferase
MRVTGVICEYNPFHNGHALHLRRARAQSGADFIVCVMSGSFTQRGEPAAFDKWTRARAALEGGADAVFELPALYALSPADGFARAGVRLLEALGVVTHLSFGVEKEALPLLDRLLALTADESPAIKARIRQGLDAGMTLPRARAQAILLETGDPAAGALLNKPNLTLALEYLRALQAMGTPPPIAAVPIAREGAGYHDADASSLASATGVRAALLRADWDAVRRAVPHAALWHTAPLCRPEALDQALLYVLRTQDAPALRTLRGMDEGLEHRLLAAAQSSASRAQLLEAVKTKRYTHARLSRLLACVLLQIPQSLYDRYPLPPYARLLGMRRSASTLLRQIAQKATLPLVNRPGRALAAESPVFALDMRATDVRALALGERSCQDLTVPPVLLE